MQYTIRQVPKAVDQALRARAKAEKKTLNQLALEALKEKAGAESTTAKRDFSYLVRMDDETYQAIQDVRAESARSWPDTETE